ncbi:MAG TPA: phage holin family protein [Gaiellaceae bacterium]|nr:phage holin family protein [Gaiellaceae bacterium]
MAAPAGTGLAPVLHDVVDRLRALVRLEGELAAVELRRKVASLGAGVALFAVAAVLLVFALGLALATIAAALATFLPTWLALLVVTVAVLVVAAVTALTGRALVRRAAPLVPEQALAEAKATGQLLRGEGRG